MKCRESKAHEKMATPIRQREIWVQREREKKPHSERRKEQQRRGRGTSGDNDRGERGGEAIQFWEGLKNRNISSKIGNLQEGGNANVRARKSRFNTSQNQGFWGKLYRFRRKTRDRKDGE